MFISVTDTKRDTCLQAFRQPDITVETNSALGDYIESSRDTFITLGQRHEIEQILSHDRHMPFTQTLFDHEPLPVTCKPLPCLMSARLQAAR